MNKIAFLITTFQRDELLFKSVESLIPFQKENWYIFIIDQGNTSKEKEQWLKDIRFSRPDLIHYRQVPFDSGVSFCRNYGVQLATDYGCDYCVLGSDSFLFNETIESIYLLPFCKFDLYGFELSGCKCGWEAKLELIKGNSFQLDFIDKSIRKPLYSVDICRNFFIARTNSLLDVKWDENLKLCEHEDIFMRYKQKGYKCAWTPLINAEKMTDRPNEYSKYRRKNFSDGQRYLKNKWGIKGWVSYKNLDRAKK